MKPATGIVITTFPILIICRYETKVAEEIIANKIISNTSMEIAESKIGIGLVTSNYSVGVSERSSQESYAKLTEVTSDKVKETMFHKTTEMALEKFNESKIEDRDNRLSNLKNNHRLWRRSFSDKSTDKAFDSLMNIQVTYQKKYEEVYNAFKNPKTLYTLEKEINESIKSYNFNKTRNRSRPYKINRNSHHRPSKVAETGKLTANL